MTQSSDIMLSTWVTGVTYVDNEVVSIKNPM